MAELKPEPRSGDDFISLWNERWDRQYNMLESYWNGFKAWEQEIKLASGRHWEHQNVSSDDAQGAEALDAKMNTPILAAHLNDLVSFLYYKDPEFFGEPFDEALVEPVNGQVISMNNMWHSLKFGVEINAAIIDFVTVGHCICKTGHVRRNATPADPKKRGDYNRHRRENRPWLSRINPFFFMFDLADGTGNLDKAQWVIEIIPKTVGEILANGDYNDAAKNALRHANYKELSIIVNKGVKEVIKGDTFSIHPRSEVFKGFERDKLELDTLVACAQIWDRRFESEHLIILGVPKYSHALLKGSPTEWSYPYLRDLPYKKADFIKLVNEPYGISHAKYLRDNMAARERLRTSMSMIVRNNVPQEVYSGPDALDPNEAAKIEQKVAGALVHVPEGGKIEPRIPVEMPDSWRIMEAILKEDFRVVSGEDALTQGDDLPSRTSATEINRRFGRRSLKIDKAAEHIKTFVLELGMQIKDHMRENLSPEEIMKFGGRSVAQYAESLRNPGALEQADFRLKLGVISSPPQTKQEQQQSLQQALQVALNPILLQYFQAKGKPFDLEHLWNKYMDTFDITAMQLLKVDTNIPPELALTESNPAEQANVPQTETAQLQQNAVNPASFLQGISGGLR